MVQNYFRCKLQTSFQQYVQWEKHASHEKKTQMFGILEYVMKIESTVTQYHHANTTTLVHVCVYITHHQCTCEDVGASVCIRVCMSAYVK